jgi:DNA-binding CsgD family transcriptional regulator
MTMAGGRPQGQPASVASAVVDATGAPVVAEERTPSAEKLWRDIVSGRFVVLRHEDVEGRRYLYVQAPAPASGKPQDLTERERLVVGFRACGQGLKRIAFELGVSVPTVTRCLARALDKLGLKNDMQLPAVFGVGTQRDRRRG